MFIKVMPWAGPIKIADNVAPSKHRCHARVTELYLEVVTGTVKGFEIGIYNIWPFKIHTSLLSTIFHIQVFAKYTYNSKYRMQNFTNIMLKTGIVLDSYFCHTSWCLSCSPNSTFVPISGS